MYGIKAPPESPLPPDGPALIVCDHTSMGDPLVLLATAGRPIRFMMAQEIYDQPHVKWVFQAFRCIPIRRGTRDVKAVRAMLEGLSANQVMGLFPEGGLDRHRSDEGHPGIGYLALKSGVPVIPASIVWEKPRPLSMFKTLFVPCRARIRYGVPLRFPQENRPQKIAMQSCTNQVMGRIEHLRKTLLD
ncbi:MAG: 1-acyl-sn-glycerol-3-phosphate acyltransferase, partial [Nitrospirota bacterium]|nr:1-acyl-sn-glycerol-3-phosphate acyltransferase [Nitrospirota bacterium]